MWTRENLKKAAWNGLRLNYWKALLVSFILVLLSGGISGGFSFNSNFSNSDISKIFKNYNFGTDFALQSDYIMGIIAAAILLALVIGFFIFIFSNLFKIFVVSPFEVGQARFFLDAKSKEGDLGNIIYSFKNKRYINVVKGMAWRLLFKYLWTLLFIVPGIVKGYAYSLVPYILADNPEMDYKRALKLSMDMTKGEKLNIFVLDLSFIGWFILGFMACCIGTIFVYPYYFATKAELYIALREKAVMNGNVSLEELNIII